MALHKHFGLVEAAWANITGKPATFPPSTHTHDDRYYTEAEVDAKLAAVRPHGHYYKPADQSIAASTWVKITDWTARGTVRGGLTHASGDFTVPESGVYSLYAQLSWNPFSGGYRQTRITATVAGELFQTFQSANDWHSVPAGGTAYLTAGEKVYVEVQQSGTGQSLSLSTSTQARAYFTMSKVA